MARLAIGVAIAAVVLYLFGFFYWGAGPPYQTQIWKQPAGEDQVGEALLRHFPVRGVYFVPSAFAETDEIAARYEQGPVAIVTMLAPDGRPMMDSSIMIGGFLLNLVTLVLIAIALKLVARAVPSYAERVGFVALVGLAAAVFIDGGGAVWWQIPWQWKLYQGVYDLAFWVIAGVILAAFVRPEPHVLAADKTVLA